MVYVEIYCAGSKLYWLDKRLKILHNKYGTSYSEKYFKEYRINGRLHNKFGPAYFICRLGNLDPDYIEYWINGKQYSYDNWFKKINNTRSTFVYHNNKKLL